MNDLIKYVFLITGTLLASLLIYGTVFGNVGRTAMWQGLEQGYISSWQMYTMHDDTTSPGENNKTLMYEDIWNNLNDITD